MSCIQHQHHHCVRVVGVTLCELKWLQQDSLYISSTMLYFCMWHMFQWEPPWTWYNQVHNVHVYKLHYCKAHPLTLWMYLWLCDVHTFSSSDFHLQIWPSIKAHAINHGIHSCYKVQTCTMTCAIARSQLDYLFYNTEAVWEILYPIARLISDYCFPLVMIGYLMTFTLVTYIVMSKLC